MKKSLLYIVGFAVIAVVFYWFFNRNKVEYNGETYEIRNDEFGIMLFRENGGGEFSIMKVYESEESQIIKVYSFWTKEKYWLHLNNRILYDIDSSAYDFSKFKEIPTSDLLK